jgi:hypothetical protein
MVSELAIRMDALKRPFFRFRNSARGHINFIYHRNDENLSWIHTNFIECSKKPTDLSKMKNRD